MTLSNLILVVFSCVLLVYYIFDRLLTKYLVMRRSTEIEVALIHLSITDEIREEIVNKFKNELRKGA